MVKIPVVFPMLEIIPLLCLIAAPCLLVALSAIDLKHWILPDELNLALALTGVGFHILTAYRFLGFQDMLLGAALGAGEAAIAQGRNRLVWREIGWTRPAIGLAAFALFFAAHRWLFGVSPY